MNDRQRRFAELVVQGRPAGRAYEKAGYEARGNAAEAAATRLLRNVQVQDYIKELRGEIKTNVVLSGREIREGLTRMATIAETEQNHTGYATLIDKLNKMDGHYAPEKIEHSGSVIDNLFGTLSAKPGLHNDTGQ